MEKREISIHYSGFIVFIVKLFTVATGIIFTLMIANLLPQRDYGVWGTFNIIVPYFTLLSGAVSFWMMRFVARDQQGATKTGVEANLGIAAIAALVYLALLPVISPAFSLEGYTLVYVVFAAQIVELYLITVFESSLQALRPEFVGYGLLIGEVLKVLLAYIFIVKLDMALLGVILAIVIAFSAKVAFYIKTLLNELRQRAVWSYIREWLKGSTFNIYNMVGDRLAAVVLLMLASPLYGGVVGAGYYYAALQIANVIMYSVFLAFALTPKLLAEGKIDEATVSLRMVLMFAIPMTAGVLALPGSYLIFLKPEGDYVPAIPVLTILAIDALIMTASSIFTYVLFGTETVDEKAKIPFKQVVRSRMFVAFSLPYVHSAVTIPTTFYALNSLANHDPLMVAIYVTGINTIMHLVTFIILYAVLRRAVRVEIPWKNIGRYAAASVPMALVLFFAHPTARSHTLIVTAIGAGIYVALLYVIDPEARQLFVTVWQAVKRFLRRLLSRVRGTEPAEP